MKCPHKETISRLAKDCLPCLRAIIAADVSRWKDTADKYGNYIDDSRKGTKEITCTTETDAKQRTETK